ncbi:MAG: aminotransferase class I/II-fold pyridoxal phosphate-dependent enzyme [Proteobacteria bacterium]|nr:aminotransferase class I/II-fold pyridoxal phosphate-dependent enzyme [Pseudomonadota bacterium]
MSNTPALPAPLPELSARMKALQPSAIIKVANAAREMKEAGEKVMSLSIGVPGFLPPAHVYEAAHAAVDQDSGDYLAGRGSAALVKAFVASMKAKGFEYAENEVCAQVGGKGALFNLLLALVNDGDEVVVPAPYWASYPEMVKLAGGVPVCPTADAQHGYKLTAAQLEAAISGKTKAVLFNNPSNPTGMLYHPDEVAAIAAVLAKHPGVWIISDDIYDELVFEGGVGEAKRAAQLMDSHPELRERLIIVQSVSKTYGMPGWRVGMVAAPKVVVDALLGLTSQSFTNLPAVTMAAAAAALSGPQDFLAEQKARLVKQRDEVLAALEKAGLPCPKPEGAFYVFPQVKGCFGKTTAGGAVVADDVSFCQLLLREEKVACVPGGAFGDAGAIRISYAGKPEELTTALAGVVRFVAGMK